MRKERGTKTKADEKWYKRERNQPAIITGIFTIFVTIIGLISACTDNSNNTRPYQSPLWSWKHTLCGGRHYASLADEA